MRKLDEQRASERVNVDTAMLRQVARWYYKDHWTRTQIAKELFNRHLYVNPENLRPINAMLQDAEELKIVRIDIPEAVLDCGPARELQKEFPHLQEIIAVPWNDTEEYDDLLRRWGVAAAVWFEQLADAGDVLHVGITGGETLFEFCEAVSTKCRDNVHVYTTSLVGRGRLEASHIDPLVNAALLWAKCGRLDGHNHYATVPPYANMSRQEIRAELDELVKRDPIREAIEEMDDINVAFAGLGLVKPNAVQARKGLTSKLTMTGLLQPAITPDELIAEGAIADLSNSFFDHTGDGEKWNFFLTAGYLDPKRRGIEFFRHMVQEKKQPVVLIAGYNKEDAIEIALKQELFNIWITDTQTLQHLAGKLCG